MHVDLPIAHLTTYVHLSTDKRISFNTRQQHIIHPCGAHCLGHLCCRWIKGTKRLTRGTRWLPWASMASAMSQASTAQWRRCSTCRALRSATRRRSHGLSQALIEGVIVLNRCQSSLCQSDHNFWTVVWVCCSFVQLHKKGSNRKTANCGGELICGCRIFAKLVGEHGLVSDTSGTGNLRLGKWQKQNNRK